MVVAQPLETSVVRSLSARVGDIVRKGETLATLDPTFSEADADQLRGKIKSLAAQIERLEAEINDTSYERRARDDEARLQAMIWTRSIEQNKAKLASFDQQVRHVMLWRTSSARSRRAPPAGFIRPCQPFLVVRPPAGPGWLHEVKHDGYRIVARKQGESVSLWTRYGADFTDRLPRIAEAIGNLPADSALIDGEAVVFRPDGRSDFGALRTKAGGAQACLVAFDLLALDAEDVRLRPIEERRDKLSGLVRGVDGVLFSEAIEAEGAVVFAHACKLGLEGIVSKRAGSLYRSGASRSWLKSKNPAFVRT